MIYSPSTTCSTLCTCRCPMTSRSIICSISCVRYYQNRFLRCPILGAAIGDAARSVVEVATSHGVSWPTGRAAYPARPTSAGFVDAEHPPGAGRLTQQALGVGDEGAVRQQWVVGRWLIGDRLAGATRPVYYSV